MGWTRFTRFLNLIDFQHTIFGLPFAYLGAFFALPGFPGWSKLFWITVAMVGARTAALCMNRAIDVHIDRKNPRTAHWSLASGEFSLGLAWGVAIVSLILLGIAAWQLNPLCLKLAPLQLSPCGVIHTPNGSPGGATCAWDWPLVSDLPAAGWLLLVNGPGNRFC